MSTYHTRCIYILNIALYIVNRMCGLFPMEPLFFNKVDPSFAE